MQNKVKLSVCSFLLVSLLLSFFGCKASETPLTKEIYALDTIITITAYGVDEEALKDAETEIRRLEGLLSVTDEQSDIFRINSSPDEWVRVSDETLSLITLSKEVSEVTKGNFDITVYPAVKLWGFTSDQYSVPSKDDIAKTSDFIDYTRIEIDEQKCVVKIPHGFSLDLGAIAKGYIADKGADVLSENGVSSALLNFGGNIRLIGAKPEGASWKIGIKTPFEEGYFATLSLENLTASTAGGYERYFEEEGKIYHHIINPHTAAPADSDVLSATVVGGRGEVCDALATSAFVAGTSGIKELSCEYPDYGFVLFTESALYVSEHLQDDFSTTDKYKDTDIILI